MKLSEVVSRARSAIGHKIKYGLGKGGFNPLSPYPWSSSGLCDCSGFVAWCLGVSRQTDNPWYENYNGGWIETTAIVRDAKVPFGFFNEVDWKSARPGMLVVYGDGKNRTTGKITQGHVGIVSSVDVSGAIRAIHCSSGNSRNGDAIAETPVAPIWTPSKAVLVVSAFTS